MSGCIKPTEERVVSDYRIRLTSWTSQTLDVQVNYPNRNVSTSVYQLHIDPGERNIGSISILEPKLVHKLKDRWQFYNMLRDTFRYMYRVPPPTPSKLFSYSESVVGNGRVFLNLSDLLLIPQSVNYLRLRFELPNHLMPFFPTFVDKRNGILLTMEQAMDEFLVAGDYRYNVIQYTDTEVHFVVRGIIDQRVDYTMLRVLEQIIRNLELYTNKPMVPCWNYIIERSPNYFVGALRRGKSVLLALPEGDQIDRDIYKRLVHELAHLILQSDTGPRWWREGLADYISYRVLTSSQIIDANGFRRVVGEYLSKLEFLPIAKTEPLAQFESNGLDPNRLNKLYVGGFLTVFALDLILQSEGDELGLTHFLSTLTPQTDWNTTVRALTQIGGSRVTTLLHEWTETNGLQEPERILESVGIQMLPSSAALMDLPTVDAEYVGGLRPGDTMLSINDRTVSADTYQQLLKEFIGQRIKVEILRNNQLVVLTMLVTEVKKIRPVSEAAIKMLGEVRL